jgi:hypothetical protein
MRMKKTLAAASALAIAIALASAAQVQAATAINPGSTLRVDSLAQVAKAKRHAHAHMHSGRLARSKRPGSCGENMYFSRKTHHCMDARNKA